MRWITDLWRERVADGVFAGSASGCIDEVGCESPYVNGTVDGCPMVLALPALLSTPDAVISLIESTRRSGLCALGVIVYLCPSSIVLVLILE